METPDFRTDLYRGTAADYDRFRVPYPPALIDDLLERAGVNGDGRLLDLACGTGQVSFAMHRSFGEVWAVDQEPDMVGFAQRKAEQAVVRNIRCMTSSAQELVAPEASFDLIAIGNAFQRLPREAVAARIRGWLRPGRCVALLWSEPPWRGDAPWQTTMGALFERWMTNVGAHSRVPPGWEQARLDRADHLILRDAGMQPVGKYQFLTDHEWTPDALIGFVFSTSFLSRVALGDDADRFEEDLRRELRASQPAGTFSQTIDFAYELARRPE
ncbi:MAG: class I SAM-dependent methyltransferase [Acidimicrobiia bacterium]